jgi:hypothetical protein
MVLSGATVSAGRALLQPLLRRVALIAIVAAALAGCGGSSSNLPSASRLLSQTFGANLAKIHSGQLSLALKADLKGLATFAGKPIVLQLSGPFDVSSAAGAAFDFRATLTLAGTSLPLGLLSTGKALYLEVAGTYYSLPASVESSLGATGSSGAAGSSNLLGRLGIDPLSWVANPQVLGTTTVAGVTTYHLTGQLAVSQLLGDLAKLARHASAVAGSSITKQLTPANLTQLASTIESARVDVYSGTADRILRELHVAIRFSIPPAGRSSLGGLSGGSIDLDVTISDLNASEKITAPASSEPFKDLLGGSGGLGSLF